MKYVLLIALLFSNLCFAGDEPKPTYTMTIVKELRDAGKVALVLAVLCSATQHMTGYNPLQEMARASGRSAVNQGVEITKGLVKGVGDGIWDIGVDTKDTIWQLLLDADEVL